VIPSRFTHAGRLERWLGPAVVQGISESMRSWPGPPIALAGVPGNVWAMPGGSFRGVIRAGELSHAIDFAEQRLRRIARGYARRSRASAGAGFSSLSDLIAEVTQGGKARYYPFTKNGSTGVAQGCMSLWQAAGSPPPGLAGSAAPGGRAPNSATTGAYPFTNPTGGDTQHLVKGETVANVAGNSLLLYDRLFDVAKTMNSSTAEAVTGVPTRYQSTTPGDMDYAGGNFLFVEVFTALPATAHNWTVCLYTDQDGNAGATLPSLVGNASAIINRLDHPAGQWFAPLAAGDSGVKALEQMQCSANVASGAINFVIGRPLAFFPCPIANIVCLTDGIMTAFNLVRIFDDAAMAYLEVMKPSTAATIYTGSVMTVAG
jgi:hypothetical protein